MSLLEIDSVSKGFGGVQALRDVGLSVEPGEIRAIIGPNGAGKTTLFNVITGVFRPTSGRVMYKGEEITRLPPHEIANRGIARTFQNVRVFGDLNALENVLMGCHSQIKVGVFDAGFSLPRVRHREQQAKERAMEWLSFVGLGGKASELVGSLPYGSRKVLELARALASDPELLLLDEPATGLNDAEREQMAKVIYQWCERGKTILLVEHQMTFVMALSDRITVLNYGEKIAEGTPLEIQGDSKVIAVYLGEEKTDA